MVTIKNFLTSDCVSGLLEKISTIEWSTTDSYATTASIPLRSVQSLDFYPLLKEQLTNQLGSTFQLYRKDRIHFNKYPTSTKSSIHQDPSFYTLIVLLQEASGGNLILNKDDLIDLSPGDAVLFKGETPHKVSTITSGERISLALWLTTAPHYSKLL